MKSKTPRTVNRIRIAAAVALIAIATLVAGLNNASSLEKSANTIELNTDNSMVIRGEINYESVDKAQKELAALAQKRGNKNYTIYISLDSPGGSIDAGLSFIEFAKQIPNVKTLTVFAASMASGIVEALPGERLVLSSGMLMFHRATVGLSGQIGDGEFESRLKMVKDMVDLLERSNYERMSLSKEEYKSKVKDELWLIGFNAVVEKAADRVVSVNCSSDLIAKRDIAKENMFFFVVDVEYSACPIFRAGKVLEPEQPQEGEQSENSNR